MYIIFSFIGCAIIAVVFTAICIYVILRVMFHCRACKYCGHHMEYKGLKEDDKDGHYLFHCHHCGAWEQIPKNIFLRNFIYKGLDPLNE